MWLLFFLLALSVALLGWLLIRDRRYLKKPTREALGRDLKQEIDRERRLFQTHKARFDAALEKAKKKLTVKREA